MERSAAARQSYAAMDRVLAPRRIDRRLLAAGIALSLLLLGSGGGLYWRWAITPTMTVAADHLTVGTVQNGIFQAYVPVSGTVEPTTVVDLDARSAGEISDIRVQDGEQVAAGQVLVALRNAALSMQVTSEQAQLAQGLAQLAAVQLDQAQSRLQHRRDLLDAQSALALDAAKFRREAALVAGGVLPRAPHADLALALDHEQAVVATLQQQVASDRGAQPSQDREMARAIATAQAGIARADDNLGDLTLTAPVAGELTGFEAHRGEAVAAGQRLGEIDGRDQLRVTAEVDQFYLGQVSVGGTATLDLGDRVVPLRVSEVEPEVIDRSFKIALAFVDAPPSSLHAGQSVQPRLLIGDAHPSLMVANQGFLAGADAGADTGSTAAVFVVSADGSAATRRSVSLGRSNPDWVEVLGGLDAGDRIVVSDTENYKDVTRITIRGRLAPSIGEITQ